MPYNANDGSSVQENVFGPLGVGCVDMSQLVKFFFHKFGLKDNKR